MLPKIIVVLRLSANFVSKCSGWQEFSHFQNICGYEENSSAKAISKLSENYSAFHEMHKNHKENLLFFPEKSSLASFPQLSEDLFPQKWENNFSFTEAGMHREDQPKKSHGSSSLSLANLINEDSKPLQATHRFQFHNTADFLPYFSSFLNTKNLAEFNPQALSTEAKKVITHDIQPSLSMNLYEANNTNLRPDFTNLWNTDLLSPYKAEDNLKMHQITQTEIKLHENSMQSDLWKVVLNYNEDDQKLLEEMLNFQECTNLLKEMLSSQDNQEVATFQSSSPSHSPNYLQESHGPDTLEGFRISTLKPSKFGDKNYNPGNSESKKRKMFEIFNPRNYKIPKAELKKKITRQQIEELVSILLNNFTIKPIYDEQGYEVCVPVSINSQWTYKKKYGKSKTQKSLDKKILQYLEKSDYEESALKLKDRNTKSSSIFSPAPSAEFNRVQARTFLCIQHIQWEGSDSFLKEISDLVCNYKDSKIANPLKSFSGRIRDISTVGVTLMKIISKLYSNNPRSSEYGNNQNILDYTKDFWNISFSDKENKAEDLANFCKSLGAKSESQMEKCLSIKFTGREQGLGQIFSSMRDNISQHIDKVKLMQYSWYFALIRASVFFSDDILMPYSSAVRLNYRNLISYGIMYFAKKNMVKILIKGRANKLCSIT
ncbi:hypothetical protein PPACK8108_LOCUS17957 [Phakopsora pachyrhizi]|uniref:Uncharacterized protein n=1 Tax=Phakopsora pachyrhizi TaxID=170000 RepID=A0AAV0B9Z5_PHAPC|nr:hypothetical protein PPACK8108_LOCUS17957 [Phakopsora pachyrhizi]